MLVIPDHNGCTVVANGKCCAYSGSAEAIVQQCFIQETELGGDATLIAPKVKKVEVIMNSAMAAAFCDAFQKNSIEVIQIASGTPRQVFGTKRLE